MRPNVFDGIEFGGVTGKRIDVKSLDLLQEGFDVFPLVNSTAVPDKDHRSAQVAQQMLQERDDFCSGDVVGMKAHVESQAFSVGGHREASNNRDFVTPITVAEDRGAAGGGPGSTDVRDEQEPAFVEEGQMGSKFLGFFLYRAMSVSSSGRWLSRLFARLVSPASGNSIPARGAKVSTRLRACNGRRTSRGSDGPLVLRSTERWNVRRLWRLSTGGAPDLLSDERSTRRVVPTWPDFGCLAALFCDSSDTTAQRNSTRLSTSLPHRGRSDPRAAGLSLDAGDSPIARDFHGVSCPIL